MSATNEADRKQRRVNRAVLGIAGGILTGVALGLLDCLIQHIEGSLNHRSSFWRWSELLLAIPVLLAVIAVARPFSLARLSFMSVIPATYIWVSMAASSVARGVRLDEQFVYYAMSLSVFYTVGCTPLAAAGGWMSWMFRKRAHPGHCRNCDYNLCGNVSGICPECGVSIAANIAE
ncbi:MAG: hypothetical protein ACKVS9_13230 [Phycisphaerae bacterium]